MAASAGDPSGVGKKARVTRMFDSIAGSYDFLNHLLSFNMDRVWRRKAIGLLRENPPVRLLDVATGTGDFACAALRLAPEEIVGLDVSEAMLAVARRKCRRKGGPTRLEFITGDAAELPFGDRSFDAVACAFGIRNFEDPRRGLGEFFRVLKSGGRTVILEFSKPSPGFFSVLYRFYFHRLLPAFGGLVSRDRQAYAYLPASVERFPEGEAFLELMRGQGFSCCSLRRLTGGIATVYTGEKSPGPADGRGQPPAETASMPGTGEEGIPAQ